MGESDRREGQGEEQRGARREGRKERGRDERVGWRDGGRERSEMGEEGSPPLRYGTSPLSSRNISPSPPPTSPFLSFPQSPPLILTALPEVRPLLPPPALDALPSRLCSFLLGTSL